MVTSSKEYFDQIGAGWDELREGLFSESVREQALVEANVQAGEFAADIGAGTGFLTEALVTRGLRVVAVDQSEAMLEALERKYSAVDDVECRVGVAEALPIDDGAVDHAFANMFIHHVENPPDAIREMARIIRPGGRLVITDLDAHDHEFLREEQHDRWLGFERDEVRAWLGEAGLVDIRVGCVGSDCCTKSSAGEDIEVGIFIASGKRPRQRSRKSDKCC
jgi:ubiquinone/menaquinone biosynthesis C-methylase UbiE